MLKRSDLHPVGDVSGGGNVSQQQRQAEQFADTGVRSFDMEQTTGAQQSRGPRPPAAICPACPHNPCVHPIPTVQNQASGPGFVMAHETEKKAPRRK